MIALTKKQWVLGMLSAAIIAALCFVIAVVHIRSHRFIETTGFYFTGIESDSIDEIRVNAFNGNFQLAFTVYCLEHYRTTDTYIYNDWRHDFRYYDYFDSISMQMPVGLANKVQTLYFKTGRTVVKVDGDEFRRQWVYKTTGNTAWIGIPWTLKSIDKSYGSTIRCFTHTSQSPVKYLRFFCYLFLILLLIIPSFSNSKNLKKWIRIIFTRLKLFLGKHRKFVNRLGAFALGIVFAFVVLEVSLRIIGYFYNKTHIEKQEAKAIAAENCIICAGDSFTESIGADPGYEYPSQLDSLVNGMGLTQYAVYNFGRSGKNSTQILQEIPRYIKKYKPKIIVVMAGGANYWNSWGFRKQSWWESLKTVKLLKLIINNIISENQKNTFSADEYFNRRVQFSESIMIDTTSLSPVLMALRTHNDDSILAVTKTQIDNKTISQLDIYHIIMYSIFTARPHLSASLNNHILPGSEWLRFFSDFRDLMFNKKPINTTVLSPRLKAAYYYLSALVSGSFDDAALKNSIKNDPYLEDTYMELVNLKEKCPVLPEKYIENRYSYNDTILYYRVLFGLHRLNVESDVVHIIENTEEVASTSQINNWVKSDLTEIVDVCRNNGVKVVLMCYPFLHKSSLSYPVNEVIRSVAREYDVILLDNEAIFDTIKTDRNTYFISDGHCSSKGYSLMSNSLYKLIVSNGLLKSEKSNNAQ